MVNKSNITAILIIVLVLIVFALFSLKAVQDKRELEKNSSPAGTALQSGSEASPFTDLDGNQILFDDYLGDVLVVNSWASWCPFCENELTKLSNLANEYEGKQVSFLAINRAEPITTTQSFLKFVRDTKNLELILDPTDHFYNSIKGFSMPETIVYGKDGSVASHYRGEINPATLRSQIDLSLEAEN